MDIETVNAAIQVPFNRTLEELKYIGPYNPDWAIVKHDTYGGQDKVFMVKETKGTTSEEQLRISELAKITFGKVHFDELGVDYSWVKSAEEA